MTLPFLGSFQQRETVVTVTQDVVQSLRRSQNRAMSGNRGEAWGVYFEEHGYSEFAGSQYDDRIEGLTRDRTLPKSITILGSKDVIFSPLLGTVDRDHEITISTPEAGTYTITINRAGGIFLGDL